MIGPIVVACNREHYLTAFASVPIPMAILTTQDKEKIKRAVPKASNKIIDATVARLYIAYPEKTQWTYTGLVGAIALVDDLVGHTFFLKLVDITGSRGVVWDQELYVDFDYHQDRKFFHTFEIEDCLVGLLFEDTNDAAHFYKRVTARQKHASKQTAANKNAIALKSRLGEKEAVHGARGEYVDSATGQRTRRTRGVLYYDGQPPAEWRSLYAELASAGISEDMIAENREFIKEYIAKQGGPLVGMEPPIPRRFAGAQAPPPPVQTSTPPAPPKKNKKAPPPPPPTAAAAPSASPSPAPDSRTATPQIHTPAESSSSPANTSASTPVEASPAPVDPRSRFRLPPANAAVPPVSHTNITAPDPLQFNQGHPPQPSQSPYGQQPQYGQQPPYGQQQPQYGQPPQPYGQQAQLVHHVPPPPPSRGGAQRPLPTPPPRAGVPAPPQRAGAPPPPPPPRSARNPPPPPPSRARPAPAQQQQQVPPLPYQQTPQPYQQPQQTTQYNPNQQQQTPPQQQYQAPPPPQPQYQAPPPPQRNVPAAPLPARDPVVLQPPLPTQNTNTAPPPPPLPAQNANAPPPPPPMPTQSTVPPPPPPPMPDFNSTSSTGAPVPPPPPPDLNLGGPPAGLPAVDSSRDALLASIRGSGLSSLKKTDKSQLEKPNVLLQEARGETPSAPPSGGGPPGQPESLADALAKALNNRKGKVAVSDDEDDEDW